MGGPRRGPASEKTPLWEGARNGSPGGPPTPGPVYPPLFSGTGFSPPDEVVRDHPAGAGAHPDRRGRVDGRGRRPAGAWLTGLRLRTAVNELCGNIRLARVSAVRADTEFRVVFDPAASRYRLESDGQAVKTDRFGDATGTRCPRRRPGRVRGHGQRRPGARGRSQPARKSNPFRQPGEPRPPWATSTCATPRGEAWAVGIVSLAGIQVVKHLGRQRLAMRVGRVSAGDGARNGEAGSMTPRFSIPGSTASRTGRMDYEAPIRARVRSRNRSFSPAIRRWGGRAWRSKRPPRGCGSGRLQKIDGVFENPRTGHPRRSAAGV